MGEDYVTREVCNERKCIMDERFARDKADITTLQEEMLALTKLVSELATMQRANTETQHEHDKRIHALEMQPAGRWDKLITVLITAVATGLGTMALNAVIGR